MAISRPLVVAFVLDLVQQLALAMDHVSPIRYRDSVWILTLYLERAANPRDRRNGGDDRRQRAQRSSQ